METTPLTQVYRNHYNSEIGNHAAHQQRADGHYDNTNQMETHSMQNMRYEIARIEAKIDILTNLVLKMDSPNTAKTSASVSASASEQALVRSLTTKQHVTAQLLIAGWQNKDIAKVINIGENTVKLHVRAVCKKVGTKTRGQAALIMNDIFEKLEPEDYKRASGGIPIDWARTLVSDAQDHYAPLYRSAGGTDGTI